VVEMPAAGMTGLASGVTIEHSLFEMSAASERPDGHVPRP